MTVKNYLVRSLYRLNDKAQSISPTDYRVYKKMHELSLSSFKQYIGGNWEVVLFEGEVDNAQQMFRDVFTKTYRLWSQEPCNILFVDLDILALGPVEFFGHYKDFAMFAQISDQYYNCGVRYFPHTMSSSVWQLGLDLYKDWNDPCEWDREQQIYSKMLCSQPDYVVASDTINVWYHTLDFYPNFLNQYKMLHFHSAKGPKPVYALMKKYAEHLALQTI